MVIEFKALPPLPGPGPSASGYAQQTPQLRGGEDYGRSVRGGLERSTSDYTNIKITLMYYRGSEVYNDISDSKLEYDRGSDIYGDISESSMGYDDSGLGYSLAA
jgi:hypothetical protein